MAAVGTYLLDVAADKYLLLVLRTYLVHYLHRNRSSREFVSSILLYVLVVLVLKESATTTTTVLLQNKPTYSVLVEEEIVHHS